MLFNSYIGFLGFGFKQIDAYKMRTLEEYIAPEVRFVEVVVEKGFLISGIIVNDRYQNEKHIVDEVEEW